MALLTKNVEVKWTQGTKKHYEEKGYKWTKLYDLFIIPTTDLPSKSNVNVDVQCDYCGVKKKIRYAIYNNNYYFKKEGKYACNSCSVKMREGLSLKEVRNRVKSLGEGYILLSEKYINTKSSIKIKCPLGHTYNTTLSVVNLGSKCPVCHELYGNRGALNPNYNANLTDEERIENRDTYMNREWRESIYKRDNYTCQKCGQKGRRLNAHHLNGYHWDKKNRFNVDNGVTLCTKCHKEYHSVYGVKNTVKEDYYDWINKEGATA